MDNGMILKIIVGVVPIVIAITLHEAAHGFASYKLGDPTAKMLGRLTLNPLKHIDPVGTILMPLALYTLSGGTFLFGYAKPVPIGVNNFRNPRRDMALTGAAGPAMNFVLALVSALLLVYLVAPISGILPPPVANFLILMLNTSVFVNVFLAALNLIPIPPLDGGRVLAGLVPRHIANKLDEIERYGMFIVILLLVANIADYFIMPVMTFMLSIIRIFLP